MKKLIRKLFGKRFICSYCGEEKGFFSILCKRCDVLYYTENGRKITRMIMLHQLPRVLFIVLRNVYLEEGMWTDHMEKKYKEAINGVLISW